MEGKVLDRIAQAFNPEKPEADTLDGYLDQILPLIKKWSEDLREEEFYVGKHWVEVRDDEKFHELRLHIFNSENEYLRSSDGSLFTGEWRYAGNKLMIGKKVIENENEEDQGEAGKVYELAFMDDEFIIAKLLANPRLIRDSGESGYLVLVKESYGRKLEWRELAEMLFTKYQNNNSFYITVSIIILLIIAIAMLFS